MYAEEHSNLAILSWDRQPHSHFVMSQHNQDYTETIVISHTDLDGNLFGAIRSSGRLEPQANIRYRAETAVHWANHSHSRQPRVPSLSRGDSSFYDFPYPFPSHRFVVR